MAGTVEGGKSAAAKNKELYGEDYYKRIGKSGGLVNHPETRYFRVNKEAAREAGAKGGTISRRKVTND